LDLLLSMLSPKILDRTTPTQRKWGTIIAKRRKEYATHPQ
jgi:hypothetical protein